MRLNAVRKYLCLEYPDPNRQHLTHHRQVAVAVPSDRLVERISLQQIAFFEGQAGDRIDIGVNPRGNVAQNLDLDPATRTTAVVEPQLPSGPHYGRQGKPALHIRFDAAESVGPPPGPL